MIAIDEIDGLAPPRQGNNGKDNSDLLNMLLSMLTGVGDIKNLVIVGATNHLSSMDAAFLRRCDFKFFVGKPSFNARHRFVERDNIRYGWILAPRVIQVWFPCRAVFVLAYVLFQFLVALTLDFSNDAMNKTLRNVELKRRNLHLRDLADHDQAVSVLTEVVRRSCQMDQSLRPLFGQRMICDIVPTPAHLDR